MEIGGGAGKGGGIEDPSNVRFEFMEFREDLWFQFCELRGIIIEERTYSLGWLVCMEI